MGLRHRVGELRVALGLSKSELARRAGISRPTLDAIERDPSHQPTLRVALGLARALGVNLPDLFPQSEAA